MRETFFKRWLKWNEYKNTNTSLKSKMLLKEYRICMPLSVEEVNPLIKTQFDSFST